jgi:D-amino-acid dehydrogenase
MPPSAEPPSAGALRQDPAVLVIGGGIVGLFCAYFLHRAGASVTVIERGSIGDRQSCSSGNTGFVAHGGLPLAQPGAILRGLRATVVPDGHLALRPHLDPQMRQWLTHFRRCCNAGAADASQRVLFEMKNRSLALLPEIRGTAGLAAVSTTSGLVVAYKTPAAFERSARAVPRAVEHGAPLRVLEPGELREIEPDVEFDISGAIFNDGGTYVNAPDFVVELATALRAGGVDIRDGTSVLGFEVSGDRVISVQTDQGDFRPGETVIAAGVWSATCARLLDFSVPVAPIKGYSITVERPRGAPQRPVLLSEGTVAIRPLGDRLRFAGSLELSGDRSISQRRVERMLRTVRSCLPAVEIPAARDVWVGLRPSAPDSLPFLGRAARYANVSVAAGHGHVGMGLAPAGGEMIAQIITGQTTALDITPFRVDRFADRSRA